MTIVAVAPLYLSRLILNPRSRQVWSELGQPYEMHRTLMRAFPKATDDTKCKARDEFGVLFRVDVDEQRNDVRVYVQSFVKPNWSFLDDLRNYLFENSDSRNPDWQDISGAYAKLKKGQVFSFRLRANPTKRIGKVVEGDSALKGKRVGLLREEEQIAWLIRKAQEREKGKSGGFEILTKEVTDQSGKITMVPRVNVRPEGKQTGRKREAAGSLVITHLAVRFDGLLQITDPDAFRETLSSGIGSAKAYGFGLLSLAPGSGK